MKNLSENVLVHLEGAGLFRNGRWLVRQIDLQVRRGEIITLIGPNGSGKSTTAKMALRIIKPDDGRVWQKPGLKVGYVPQKISIDRALPLTVSRLMQLTGRPGRKEIDSVLDEVGMRHLLQAQLSTLSGGELQRVLLARASIGKPDLLVLDEPLQGVDSAGETALYALISRFRERLNCGILLISHDLHIVMTTSDHILCLNGSVCCQGKPAEVVASTEYHALFTSRQRFFPEPHPIHAYQMNMPSEGAGSPVIAPVYESQHYV